MCPTHPHNPCPWPHEPPDLLTCTAKYANQWLRSGTPEHHHLAAVPYNGHRPTIGTARDPAKLQSRAQQQSARSGMRTAGEDESG